MRCQSYIVRPESFVMSLEALGFANLPKTIYEPTVKLPLAGIVQRLIVQSCQYHVRRCDRHGRGRARYECTQKWICRCAFETHVMSSQKFFRRFKCGHLNAAAQYGTWEIPDRTAIESSDATFPVDLLECALRASVESQRQYLGGRTVVFMFWWEKTDCLRNFKWFHLMRLKRSTTKTSDDHEELASNRMQKLCLICPNYGKTSILTFRVNY